MVVRIRSATCAMHVIGDVALFIVLGGSAVGCRGRRAR